MALTILITNAGRAALINADKSGTRAVRVAAVGVSPTATVPAATATTLPGEIKRIATISGAQTAADTIHLTVQDESAAVYAVRSFGLYLDDGTLFAIYGQADVIVEKSAQALLLLAIDVTLQDIAATSITFGNANFLLPAATTERQGLVELATADEGRAGTDTTRAVTPAVAKASVQAWLGYTPANRAGDTFTGPVAIRTPNQNLGFSVASSVQGYAFMQLGDAGETFRNWHFGSQGDGSFALYQGTWGTGSLRLLVTSTSIAYNGNPVWHAGNDGAGSGLDADLLDGFQAAQFMRRDVAGSVGTDVYYDFGNSQYGRSLRVGGPANTGAAVGQITVTTGNIHIDSANSSAIFLNYFAGDGVNFGNGQQGFNARITREGGFVGTSLSAPTIVRGGMSVWGPDNDGAGSGLDADLVRGRSIPQDLWLSQSVAQISTIDPDSLPVGGSAYSRHTNLPVPGTLHYVAALAGGDVSDRGLLIASPYSSGELYIRSRPAGWTKLWSPSNDGAGSGLDADLLDGRQGSEFALKSGDAFTGQVTMRSPAFGLRVAEAGSGYGFIQLGEATGANVSRNWHFGSLGDGAFGLYQGEWGSGTERLRVTSAGINFNGGPVWHAGNDGAGSGLDADMLDGLQAAQFMRRDVAGSVGTDVYYDFGNSTNGRSLRVGGIANTGAPVGQIAVTNGNIHIDPLTGFALFLNFYAGEGINFGNGKQGIVAQLSRDGGFAAASLSAPSIVRGGLSVWGPDNDGAGSGLDSDMVDGWQADDLRRWGNLLDRPGSFPPSAHGHSASDIAGAFANASLAANGYQVLPNGLILQWVTGPYQSPGVEAAVFVGWPIAFPNACFQAFPSTQIQSATDRGDSWFQLVGDPATDGCTVMRQRSGNPNDSAATAPKIFAIGR
ncbi:hypothetical protein QE452_002713 [Sphingomonas sp. SORGH_AS438]|nr:hypothetical protein [Sphingomonas sp. SORGH_AS_0438]